MRSGWGRDVRGVGGGRMYEEWAVAGCMRSEQGLDVRGVGGGGMYEEWGRVGM